MKITPLDIRQKDFEKTFRGYDKEEVEAFLQSLSQEWEKTLDEIKTLKQNLENAEREANRLKEVESSLFKTLKSAEDTGASLLEQATKSAELHIREAQLNAEAIMSDAKTRAKAIIEEAEYEAKKLFVDLKEEVALTERDLKEVYLLKENLLSDMINIGSDYVAKAERFAEKQLKSTADKKIRKIIELEERIFKSVEQSEEAVDAASTEITPIAEDVITSIKVQADKVAEEPKSTTRETENKKSSTSFFDEI
jgi:cell division initiation protein